MAKLYRIPFTKLAEGWDLLSVYDACATAVEAVRSEGKPRFIEINTFRYKEHVGISDDFHYGYRSHVELERWQRHDPLVQETALVEGLLPKIDAAIEAAVAAASASSAPGVEHLLTDVA
jgi:pyruvate dehydrogenase E1 component alpha subunit